MYKIAFCGSHSTGKTTLANKISKQFDLKLISNLSRKISKKENLKLNKANNNEFDSNQLQIKLLDEHKKILDLPINIIQDRSMYDVVSYSYCFLKNNQITNLTFFNNIKTLFEYYLKYDLIIYVSCNGLGVVNDGIRDVDVNYQLEIDVYIRNYLKEFKPRRLYVCEESDWGKREEKVINYLRSYFNEKTV